MRQVQDAPSRSAGASFRSFPRPFAPLPHLVFLGRLIANAPEMLGLSRVGTEDFLRQHHVPLSVIGKAAPYRQITRKIPLPLPLRRSNLKKANVGVFCRARVCASAAPEKARLSKRPQTDPSFPQRVVGLQLHCELQMRASDALTDVETQPSMECKRSNL